MRTRLISIVLSLFAATASAEDVTDTESLRDYLREQLNTTETIGGVFRVGSTYRVQSHNQSCFGPRSLRGLPLALRIMHREYGVRLVEEGQSNHGVQTWSSPGCTLKISSISETNLARLGVETGTASDGVEYVRVAYTRQEFLGVESVSFRARYIGDSRCDITFVPWFRNFEPSDFVQRFADEFRRDTRMQSVFQSQASTRRWCLKRRFDGSLQWLIWSRY